MKTRLPHLLVVAVLAIAFIWLPVTADAQQMNYSGRLTDDLGAPLTALQTTLEFNIYDAATGGTKVWGPFTLDADLIAGRFNVALGPNDTNNPVRAIADALGGDRFIHIKVGNNAALPRQKIFATPQAMFATQAGNANTALLAINAVNAQHAATADTVLGTIENATNAITAQSIIAPNRKLQVSSTATLGGPGSGAIKFRPDGTNLGLLMETTAGGESAGFFLNGNTAVLWSPGDSGIFKIFDEDAIDNQAALGGTPLPVFQVNNDSVQMDRYTPKGGTANASIHNTVVSLQEENLRIVRGGATANATVGVTSTPLHGRGFTYIVRSQGVVDVFFDVPFVSTPTVTVTPMSNGAIFGQVEGLPGQGFNPGPTGFRAIMRDTGGGGRAWPFSVIAIGPR